MWFCRWSDRKSWICCSSCHYQQSHMKKQLCSAKTVQSTIAHAWEWRVEKIKQQPKQQQKRTDQPNQPRAEPAHTKTTEKMANINYFNNIIIRICTVRMASNNGRYMQKAKGDPAQKCAYIDSDSNDDIDEIIGHIKWCPGIHLNASTLGDFGKCRSFSFRSAMLASVFSFCFAHFNSQTIANQWFIENYDRPK